jgi:signal transduction histidine kinase
MSLARRWRSQEFKPSRGDLLLAALTVLVSVSVLARAIVRDEPLAVLLIPGAVAAILLRRRRPVEALLIAVAIDSVSPDNRFLVLPAMVVLYTIALRARWKLAAGAAAAAAVVAIVAGIAWGGSAVNDHGNLWGYAIGTAASFGLAVALGLYVAARRRVMDGLRERAERLDRERELLADRAVAEEQIRIAQELHDIIAHNVSLMVVEAQALGATREDEQVTQSTNAIAELGRQAMSEMHATLRLLRTSGEGPEMAPQPGLDQLESLMEQLRRAGLEVELTIAGQPRPLPQSVDLSAFRIVQEALTNVVKHAAGARTDVKLAYGPDTLVLTIVDRGVTPPLAAGEPPNGHGVIGMRERAAMFGGTLDTEALTDGFRVTATLPYDPSTS